MSEWINADRLFSEDEDALANMFALAFLMPQDEYERVLRKNTDGDIVNTAAIAKYFHVSITDAAARGVQLGYLRQW